MAEQPESGGSLSARVRQRGEFYSPLWKIVNRKMGEQGSSVHRFTFPTIYKA